jgi:hypothetical protein
MWSFTTTFLHGQALPGLTVAPSDIFMPPTRRLNHSGLGAYNCGLKTQVFSL